MTVVAAVLVLLAAALHVAIFWMESVGWMRPSVFGRFGLTSAAEAEATRAFAYNQGFYNLFLAIVAVVGVVLIASGGSRVGAGVALAIAATASMLAAALVLLSTGRHYLRAALTQGTVPALAVLCTIIAHA